MTARLKGPVGAKDAWCLEYMLYHHTPPQVYACCKDACLLRCMLAVEH